MSHEIVSSAFVTLKRKRTNFFVQIIVIEAFYGDNEA